MQFQVTILAELFWAIFTLKPLFLVNYALVGGQVFAGLEWFLAGDTGVGSFFQVDHWKGFKSQISTWVRFVPLSNKFLQWLQEKITLNNTKQEAPCHDQSKGDMTNFCKKYSKLVSFSTVANNVCTQLLKQLSKTCFILTNPEQQENMNQAATYVQYCA